MLGGPSSGWVPLGCVGPGYALAGGWGQVLVPALRGSYGSKHPPERHLLKQCLFPPCPAARGCRGGDSGSAQPPGPAATLPQAALGTRGVSGCVFPGQRRLRSGSCHVPQRGDPPAWRAASADLCGHPPLSGWAARGVPSTKGSPGSPPRVWGPGDEFGESWGSPPAALVLEGPGSRGGCSVCSTESIVERGTAAGGRFVLPMCPGVPDSPLRWGRGHRGGEGKKCVILP